MESWAYSYSREPWRHCRRLTVSGKGEWAGAPMLEWSNNSENALEGEADFASDYTAA
jgi:hypothetical protein